MQFTVHPNQKPMNQGNQGNDMGDMLNDILRSKPNFGGDVFGGPVFQSKWKWFWCLKIFLLIFRCFCTWLTKLESFETFIEFILFIIGINKTYNRMDTRNKKNPIAGYMGYVPSR